MDYNIFMTDIAQKEISLSAEATASLVSQCLNFKEGVKNAAISIKANDIETLRAIKNEFGENRSSYLIGTQGTSEKAGKQAEPVFFPLTSTVYNTALANLLGSLIASDTNWFRVRATTAEGAALEDDYTEAVKAVFQRDDVTQRIKDFASLFLWSSAPCARVYLKKRHLYEQQAVYQLADWQQLIEQKAFQDLPPDMQAMCQQVGFQPKLIEDKDEICIEIPNPDGLYLEAEVNSRKDQAWVYIGRRKKRELLNDSLLLKSAVGAVMAMTGEDNPSQSGSTGQNPADIVDNLGQAQTGYDLKVNFDTYYFPFISAGNVPLHNVTICVANDSVVTHILFNTLPNGDNPLIVGKLQAGIETYSLPPLRAIQPHQRLINKIFNFIIDEVSRSSRLLAISSNADITQFFGQSGGMIITDNPGRDVQPIEMPFNHEQLLMSIIAMIQQYSEATTGIAQPQRNDSESIVNKTATEIDASMSQMMGVVKEMTETVGHYVLKLLQQVLYYLPKIKDAEIEVPVINSETGQTDYKMVDLTGLAQGYQIELTTINPDQSKNAQVQLLTQMIQLVGSNPDILLTAGPLVEKVLSLSGMKDSKLQVQQLKEGTQMYGAFMGFQQQALAAEGGGMGAMQ
jgi:hypothetical protein